MAELKEYAPSGQDMQDLECIRLMDSDVLHNFLVELYQASRDGSSAVHAFCRMFLTGERDASGNEHPYADRAWGYNYCAPCDTDTPIIPNDDDDEWATCACCSCPVNTNQT